jgi:alpha-beta hydrolase superfamily lysophospholipase
MKKIYIAVAAFFVLSMALFVASFAYLDRSKHRTYDYVVTLDGHDAGTIQVDKFITEDKLIYKSAASMPFYPFFTEYRSRLDLDKKYNIEDYYEEMSAGRVSGSRYLESSKGLVSYVSRYQSRFAYVDNIPTKRGTFVFEEDSPMTYLPIIENYNFSRGRSQVFNTIGCPDDQGLPPERRIMVFTSIKDEYLKVDSRKIKTENLIIKTRDRPPAAVWVAKSDRAIIKIEIPAKGIAITRRFRPRALNAKGLSLQDPRYMSKEVTLKSGDAELAGTLTTPTREGRFPAVLLVGGGEPSDRDLRGLFASIADELSKNGFCVLRYDRRGIGASKGDASASTENEEAADAQSALDYLREQDAVDPDRIAVLGHAKGAYYALKVSAEKDYAKGLVLMAPVFTIERGAEEKKEDAALAATKAMWPKDYAELALRTARATEAKVRGAKGDWINILGKRCHVKTMREEMSDAPMAVIGKVKAPVFILQGRDDDSEALGTAAGLDKALAEAGNTNHTLKYYGYLGRFFGAIVNDGSRRIHYDTDKAVMANIKDWLDKVLVKPAPEPVDTGRK